MLDIKQIKQTTKAKLDAVLYTEKQTVKSIILDASDKGFSFAIVTLDPSVADVIIKELKEDGFSVFNQSATGYDDTDGYKITWY